jgi:cytochrome c oxidase assembly factor CtaG
VAWRAALVWVLHATALWAWHAPALYQAALADPLVHALGHASLLGAAGLFWWSGLQPTGHRRLDSGLGVLFLFGAAVRAAAWAP